MNNPKIPEQLSSQEREKDIIELCRQVINANPEVYYNPNGADTSTCPFCGKYVSNNRGEMSEIKHTSGCAYNIAKDLSTGLL